jgi:hypothetical protein
MRRSWEFRGWRAWATVAGVLFFIFAAPAVLWFYFLRSGPTFYASGFTEAKFASLREGMTPGEVETVIGPPLEIVPQHDGTTLWTYSNRDDSTCDFEMRWVYFRGGVVDRVIKMYWDD